MTHTKQPVSRATARSILLAGVAIAIIGVIGFWLSFDVVRGPLSIEQRELLGLADDEFHASFVVAGRDLFYSDDEADPIYAQDGTIIGWKFHGYSSKSGTNTDTIIYVDIRGSELRMITIPRDLYLEDIGYRINTVYHLRGADGLRNRVAGILGVPIDYHVIIKLDIFENLVDALGGVEVNIPYHMRYTDNAGGLYINFPPGPTHLNGADAGKFVRYRNTARSDYDRLDNVKRLANALVLRLKELNVRAASRIPELANTFFADVETNATPALVSQLLQHLPNLTITASATLPTNEDRIEGVGSVVLHSPREVNEFMATTLGGKSREFDEGTELNLLITNRSGIPEIEQWFAARLLGYGIPEDHIATRTLDPEPADTRIITSLKHWDDAEYYSSLLLVGRQQTDRLGSFNGKAVDVELVLGADTLAHMPPALAREFQPEIVEEE